MPWYRKNSATNTSVAGGVNNWRQIANLYRRNSSGNWEQIKRVYRKNSNSPTAYQGPGAWVLVHNSDTLNPYNTITPEFTTSTGRFHDTAVITLTRGTWANTGTSYAPVTYDLDIQYSTDNTNWTNMVTGSGTTLTYTITSSDVSPPSYYFRGRVRVKNSSSVYSGYITVLATERSYRDIDVTYLFTTMNGHNYQASWTLSKTNNSTNVNTQRIEIRTNDSFTYNGTSYSPLDLVYSVTVPAGTGTQQINFLNANIKDNQSYYTELVIIANDSDQTETYEIGDDFTYQGIPVIAPFGIVSFTKGGVSGSSQGATRTTALSWGSATNASRYEVYYQGRDSSSDPWTDLRFIIPYIYEPTTDTTQAFTTGQTPTFKNFIRARIRASNTQGSTMIFNTGDYVEATGNAPGQPSFGTITKTDTTASIPVTAGLQGSHYRYEVMEYQIRTSPFGSYPGTWSTQVLSSGSGTISLSNLSANQLYYIKIRNRNYDEIYSAENETNFQTNASLTGATSTSITSMVRLNDNTVRAFIGSSGASGPYYQLFWTSQTTAPTTASYDAASTTSTVMEDFGFSSGFTYYFYVRSSSENLGDTTQVGSGTAGTFSSYGPTNGAASYTFVSPSGATSSVSGSSTVGSQLTLTANSPTSAAPTASRESIVWRVNDGGTGGNSFTAGSVLQNGGTLFTIPQYLYGSVSSVGYSIRAEVTWNNGVGSQTANSTPTAVTSSAVSQNSAPTARASSNNSSTTVKFGDSITWSAGSYSNASSVTSVLIYSTATSNLVSPNGNTLSSYRTNNPYVIQANDPTGTPYVFAVRDTVVGTNGTTYYFYSNQITSALADAVAFSYNAGVGASGGWSATVVTAQSGATYSITATTGYSVDSSTGKVTVTGLGSNSSTSIIVTKSVAGTNSTTATASGTSDTVASGPTSPTSLGVTTNGTVSSNLGTTLTRNSATNKTQSWTTATTQSTSVTWTKGTGTGTITSDVKWNQTGVAPGSSDSGTWNGVSGSSQTDSNGGGTTNYYWVRTSDGSSVKSAWVYAGSYTAASPSMSGLVIRIYRGNGSSFSTGTATSTSTSGSYTYSGLTNRDASPDFGHYAYASGTLNGVSKTATSSTV
jgi:hypothetical protein